MSSVSNVSISNVQSRFNGAGGVEVFCQRWHRVADGTVEPKVPRAIVVVVHGFGEHSDRYANLVNTIVPQGYAVYSLDHRGHGRSAGKRAYIDRYANLIADINTVVDNAKAANPGVETVMLGHSMGGNLAISYALDNGPKLHGLILSGALASTHGVPKPLIWLAKLLGRVAPKLGVTKLSATDVSSDPAVVAAYEADPLVFHDKMPAGTAAALLASSLSFPSRLGTLKMPLLVVHGSNDKLVSVESGKLAYNLAGSKDKTLKVYEGFSHEVMNEPKKDEVLTDISEWLNAHCKQVPAN